MKADRLNKILTKERLEQLYGVERKSLRIN